VEGNFSLKIANNNHIERMIPMKKEQKKIVYSSSQPHTQSTTQFGEQIPSQFQWMTSDMQRMNAEKLEKEVRN